MSGGICFAVCSNKRGSGAARCGVKADRPCGGGGGLTDQHPVGLVITWGLGVG